MKKSKKKKIAPNPVGKPTLYLEEYCDKLIEHMASGLSYESFAALVKNFGRRMGVNRNTLYDWEKVHPEWCEAKEIGHEHCRFYWEKLGIEHVVNKSDSLGDGISSSRSLNAAVWSLNMRNRFRDEWREKQAGEEDKTVTHIGKITVQQPDLNDRINQIKGKK